MSDSINIISKAIIYTIAFGFAIPVVGTFAFIAKDTYTSLKHFFEKF